MENIMAAERLIESNEIANGTIPAPTVFDQAAFQKFGTLPLFRTAGPALPAATPLLAHAWAESIALFCETGVTAGCIDPSQPLYLLDMAPAQGHLAWLMLPALHRRLAATCPMLDLRMVACSADDDVLRTIASHPYLADYIDNGLLDTALWNVEQAEGLHLQKSGATLSHTANPIVMLCPQWLHTLPADLVAVHHGHLMEGSAAATAMPDQEHSWSLAYDWRNMDDADVPWLLTQYCSRFSSAPLLLPTAACAAIDRIRQLSGNRYLLLSCDAGACSERQLRLGAMSPPSQWHAATSRLPLDYHALSLHQQHIGAYVWNRQPSDAGLVMHAAIRDDDPAYAEHALSIVAGALQPTHPDDSASLADPAAHSSAALTLTLLRLSHYDPRVLQAGIAGMLDCPPSLSDRALLEWQSALELTVSNYLPSTQTDSFYFDAGLLAIQLGHWGIARHCFRSLLSLYGDNAVVLHHLAYCEANTGRVPLAISILADALGLVPDHPHCAALHDELCRRRRHWQNLDWHSPQDEAQDELTLEPLGNEHAGHLLYQYRDPQIGIMTRLPELETLDDAQQWIAEQRQETGRICCAVMHERYGFIGIASLRRAGDAAYFYFWIGTDFQDAGYGREAAALLFSHAQHLGIAHIFTSAYTDNTRSLNALRHLGFDELPIRAQEPDDDLIFFRLELPPAATMRDADACLHLRELCAAIDSVFAFASDILEQGEKE
jgi:RimJ/RimL family protein N-acetyltransferase